MKRLSLALFLICSMSHAGDVRFWKESIKVVIHPPDTVAVTGVYFFKAPAQKQCTVRLYYPFPTDSIMFCPHWIDVTIGTNRKAGPLDLSCNGFTIDAGPALKTSQCTVTVSYKQRVRKPAGRYILTTTQYWNEPLEAGDYSVEIPSGRILEFLSYPSDTVEQRTASTVYRFHRDFFLPDRDLSFSWH